MRATLYALFISKSNTVVSLAIISGLIATIAVLLA
jgi:hypothetical protein